MVLEINPRAVRLLFLLVGCFFTTPAANAVAPPSPPTAGDSISATRLNEVGRLLAPLPAGEVLAWKQELKTTHPTAERGAWLHLWLGEWELASNQQPARASWHFRQAQHLTNPHNHCYGLAAYDQAIALFYEGAYSESSDAFAALLQPKTSFPGYHGRDCALWLRQAQACANYHAERAKLGIPEPPRLDPFCGAAALAACLHSLTLPYDRQTVLKSCVVTGEGSSLQDVLNAGRKLGLNAPSVTADDQGLMALPKPLVAYVERDHFVALVRADKAGISYLCSDCGPWPGGRVNLTWAQWHALDPGTYAVVTKRESKEDVLIREALTSQKALRPIPVAARVSYAGSLSALRLRLHASALGPLSALRGHVNDYKLFAKAATCGHKPEALHCLSFAHCPTIAPASCSCNSSTAHDPVNLATGEEEYTPEPDLVVYNPIGPSVSWSRIYNSLRDLVVYPDQTPADYGVGWSYSYNIRIYSPSGTNGPAGPVYIVFPNGSAIPMADPSTATTNGYPFTASYDGFSFTLTMRDHSRWIFNAPYSHYTMGLSQIMDRNGHSIWFNYYQSGPKLFLGSITDDNNKILLGIDSRGVSDCYNRSVWYQMATFGDYSYPELTNVSQVVPTTDSPPSPFPSRYAYNYTNAPSGDAAEVVPFLHTITVPSPTGTGTSTATLWYLNQPNDGVTTNPNYSTASNSGPFVSAIVDSNGNTTTIKPLSGVNQSRIQVIDNTGKVVRSSLYSFDSQMRMTSLTDYNQNTTQTMIYNDPYYGWNPSTVTDGNGKQWSFSFDGYGNIVTKTPPAPRWTTNYTYDYTYPKMGELRTVKTGRKSTTSISYDHTKGYVNTSSGPFYFGGYISHVSGPLPGLAGASNYASTSLVFDNWGNLTSLTTPGNSATYTNPADPSTDQGVTTKFGYTTDGSYSQAEAIGQPLTMADNLGHVTHFRYDALGRSSSVADALGNLTSYAYNQADQPLQVTRPATRQTGSGQSYTAYSYQYMGGPLAALTAYDESNNVVRQVNYQYGNEGETLAVGGSTGPAQYGYDGLYRTVALADGNGHGTHYYFNPSGYLDSVTYPGYTGPAYPNVSGPDSVRYPSYDGDGNPLRRIDGNGVETDYAYNDLENLLTNIHYPGGQLADVSYVYDLYGRVSSMTDGTGATNYEGAGLPGYDDLDNPLAVQTAYIGIPAQTIGYGYYNDGSRQTMTMPARTYTYNYDAAGRLTQLLNNVGESTSWGYQSNNWLTSQADYNGLQMQAKYNPLGQLTDLQNISGGALLSEFGSAAQGSGILHDGAGNVTTVPANVPAAPALTGTTSYGYDYGQTGGRSQLTQEDSTRGGTFGQFFSYDPTGNPTALRGTPGLFNADNQIMTPAANNPAFAADGNGNPGAARGHALTFDPENRLALAGDQTASVPTAAAVGPDNVLRLLNTNSDGSISILNVSLAPGGGVTKAYGPYGPIPGWTCVGLAVGPDNNPRVLWNRADGVMSVWTIQPDGSISSTPGYNPVGWTCTALAVGGDGLTRVLWNRADGVMSVWTIQPDGSISSTPGYNPAGWACTGLAVGTDNLTRVLWTRTSDGIMSVWTMNGGGFLSSTPGYVPPSAGWNCTGIAVGPDNVTRALWRRADGAAQTWVLAPNAAPNISPLLSPQAGYVPVNLAMDYWGNGRLLYSDSRGNNYILNILGDNATTGVQFTLAAGHLPATAAGSGYRGDGLRAYKDDAYGRTYYLYDGTLPVAELNGSGSVTAVNTFGAAGLVSRNVTGAGNTLYAFDERGNVAQRTSGGGALLSTDVYDGFGTKRAGAADVWGFGGQAGYYTDPETGLVLCTHRFYDPQQGRFLTRDPMGYGGGINLYGYVGNNPVNGMDPDGTDDIDNTIMVTLTGVGALGGGVLGAGGGGVAGFGVGAIPGAIIGAGVGGAAGAASGVVAVEMRHALMSLMRGYGGGGIEAGPVEDEAPTYKGSDKHKPVKVGNIGAEPKDGQAALDNSIQIKDTSPRRIGTDPANDEIVVLDRTHPEGKEYHGHVRSWDELEQKMKNALTTSGRCDGRGKILR